MSDLERRIAHWRRALATATGGHDEVVQELESHLREEMQRLREAGHSEEEALELAAVRLGSPADLAAEFAKLAPPAPAPWLPVRLAAFAAVALAAGLAGYLAARLQAGRSTLLLASHTWAVTLGYTATFLAGALTVCYVLARSWHDLAPGQVRSLARSASVLAAWAAVLTAGGMVLSGWWAQENLGRAWDWDAREIGAALVLAWDLLLVALWWRGGSNEHAGVMMGLVGNVVVSFAWFGPWVTAGLLPAGPLVLFALSQVVLFSAGFAPPGWLRGRGA
jgi:hypothetical protein